MLHESVQDGAKRWSFDTGLSPPAEKTNLCGKVDGCPLTTSELTIQTRYARNERFLSGAFERIVWAPLAHPHCHGHLGLPNSWK